MVSIPFAGVFVGGFLFTLIGSKVNISWVILLAKIMQASVTVLMFFKNRWIMLFARFCFGIGIALTSPTSMSLVTESTPTVHKGRVVPLPANSFNLTQIIVFQMSALVSAGILPY